MYVAEWIEYELTKYMFASGVYDDIRRAIGTGGWGTYLGLVPSASRIEEARNARERLHEFGSLADDWDGYGAAAISPETLKNSEWFLSLIEAAPGGLPIPDVSPTPSGTIAFAWEAPTASAYVEIGNTRFSGYITGKDGAPRFLEGLVVYLDQNVISELQCEISDAKYATPSITEISTRTLWNDSVAT